MTRFEIMHEALEARRRAPDPEDQDKPARRGGGAWALAAAIAASLLFHAGLAWWFAEAPLGRMEPLTSRDRRVVAVHRAPREDMVIEPRREEAGEPAPEVSLAERSRELLAAPLAEAPPAPAPPAELSPAPAPEPRAAAPPPSPDPSAAEEAQGPFEPPPFPEESLPPELAPRLAYVGDETENPGATETGAAPASGAADAARALLAGATLPAGGGEGGGKGGIGGAGGATAAAAPPMPRIDPPASPAGPSLPLTDDPLPGVEAGALPLAGDSALEARLHLDADFRYAITRYESEPDAGGGGLFGLFRKRRSVPHEPSGWFRLTITPRETLDRLATMPKDVIFMLDVSGSIPDTWIRQAARGIEQGLGALNEGDRFNIVRFNRHPELMSRAPLAAGPEHFEEARRFLAEASSAQTTDVNQALSRMLLANPDPGRVYYLVLLSDGQPTTGVVDARELINLITRENRQVATIHCIGIGPDQDRRLLEFLAYRNRGRALFTGAVDEVAPHVRRLMGRIRYPVLTGVRFSALGVDPERIYPRTLPDIHRGEPFELFGRYDARSPLTMRLAGRSGTRPVDFTFTRHLEDAPAGKPEIARDWAFWKLHHLYSRIMREGEQEALKEAVRALERDYGLKTLY